MITLYLTHFRRARVSLIVGSTIGVNHDDQGDGWSVYLPITFTNDAQSAGLVNRCSLILSLPNAGQTVHYIEWTEFRKRDAEKRRYVRDEFAGPIQVEGRTSVSKFVWFKWRTGEQVYPAGKYELELVVWKENEPRPAIRQKHYFYLDEHDAQKLLEYRAAGKTIIVFTGLDKQIESNKLVTQHEIEKLLS